MKRQTQNVQKVKKEFATTKTPPFAEWKPWYGLQQISPGHYFASEDDIDSVRAQFLQSGRHPRVQLKDETSMKSLRYTCTKLDKMSGTVIIHSVPKYADEIYNWLTCLGLQEEYRGEGLPSTSYKVLLQLLKRRERMYLTGEQKPQLLEEHNHKCAVCGSRSNQLEWDHNESFATSLDEQTIDSFQPLCPS